VRARHDGGDARYTTRLAEDCDGRLLQIKHGSEALDIVVDVLARTPIFAHKSATATLQNAAIAAQDGGLSRVAATFSVIHPLHFSVIRTWTRPKPCIDA
jgi:hypothetical protein